MHREGRQEQNHDGSDHPPPNQAEGSSQQAIEPLQVSHSHEFVDEGGDEGACNQTPAKYRHKTQDGGKVLAADELKKKAHGHGIEPGSQHDSNHDRPQRDGLSGEALQETAQHGDKHHRQDDPVEGVQVVERLHPISPSFPSTLQSSLCRGP